MRRSLAGVTVIAMMLIPIQVLAEVSASASYKDTFSSGGYTGSDGTLAWESPWREIGEGDGPGNGFVQVDVGDSCRCLYIEGAGENLALIGVVRPADLSMFESVELSYDVRRYFNEDFKDEADAQLLVQVSTDGASWKTLKTLNLDKSDGSSFQNKHDVTGWIAESFAVRYVVTGILGGAVFVDDVELEGETTTTTTTTTTTEPKPSTTIEPKPTTTTTEHKPTTKTEHKPAPTERRPAPATTSTTLPPDTTTTTASTNTDKGDSAGGAIPTDGPPPGSGIREADTGMQADYESDLFGKVEMEKPSVMGVELSADYLIAVEVIEASWMWMLGLGLVIAWAIVSNVERKRPGKGLAGS